jgi:hypothetical protein
MDNYRRGLSDEDEKLDWLRKEVLGIANAIASLSAGLGEVAQRLSSAEAKRETIGQRLRTLEESAEA